MGDPSGRRLGQVDGRLDWNSAIWEDDTHFLTLAQGDSGKAAIIRCTVTGSCERASRMWSRPVEEHAYYTAPPVLLASA